MGVQLGFRSILPIQWPIQIFFWASMLGRRWTRWWVRGFSGIPMGGEFFSDDMFWNHPAKLDINPPESKTVSWFLNKHLTSEFHSKNCSIYVLPTLSRAQAMVVSFYKRLDSRIVSWNDICSNWKIEITYQCELSWVIHLSIAVFFCKKHLLLRSLFFSWGRIFHGSQHSASSQDVHVSYAKINGWGAAAVSMISWCASRCWFILIPGVTLRGLNRHKLSPVNI